MADSPTRTMRATRTHYRPIEELGHGATATVWRARDTRTGRDVALKRFHQHLVADPVARERIEEEVAAASRLSHPNIVTAVDVIDDRDGLALVFPFVRGATLAKRLEGGQRLPPRDAGKVALDIADGLAAAHASGVIHRDVKPANILLGTDGNARLLDFGIAHAIDELGTDHRLTGAGMAIGTLPYMAPEQLAAGPITPASDVYALGVVAYEMLAGRQPYEAASPVTLATEQTHTPEPIEGVPAPLMQLTLDSMNAAAAVRPDAAQLARGLRAWLDGRTEAEAATRLVVATERPAAPVPPRHTRPLLAWLAVGLAAVLFAVIVPMAAANWLNHPPATLDLARATIDHIAVAAAPSPATTPATTPTPAPVLVATAPQPTPGSGGGGGGGHHKHHKHHKHHHGHGH